VLGPHARHALQHAAAAFHERCDGCCARHRCAGVPQDYLDVYAADLELRVLS
jgi:hypothetical protein